MKIDNEVLTVLDNSSIEGNVLKLPAVQLERKLYERVAKVIECMGGKWNRKAQGMVFESDPIDLIDTAVLTGEVVDKKKEFQFFETTKIIVPQMIELADIQETDETLEPSAGRGAIAAEMLKITKNVDVIELNTENYEYLLQGGYRMCVNADFLTIKANFLYDKIVMNPPFCKQQDIDHVMYACQLLKESGTLVSVMSEGAFFRENQKAKNFRTMLSEYGYSIPLDEGAFKESGTNVKTRLVVIKNH
jgi:hypothetical protein